MPAPRARALALGAVAILVLVEFVARGPYRALHGNSTDLTVHYAATRVWLAGGDPYDMRAVGEAFLAAGGEPAILPSAEHMPSIYPAVTNVVELPLALLDWRGAVVATQALTLVLVVAALLALARHSGLDRMRTALLFIGGLALAPLQTGVAEGQVTIPSAALLVLGWTCLERRPWLSGVLVALGAALKPQLALPIVAAALVRPRIRWMAAAAGLFGALFAVGALRLSLAGHAPIDDWLRAVAAASGPGGMNSPSPANPDSITLVNLDGLLWRLAGGAVPSGAALALTLPLAAFALWRLRTSTRRGELHAVSLLCVVALLAMYHRVYDAVLLWVPLAAFLRDGDSLPARLRVLGAVVLAGFVFPGPVILDLLAQQGRIPAAVAGSAAWRLLVLPHQIWLLCAAAVGLALLVAGPQGRAEVPAADHGAAG